MARTSINSWVHWHCVENMATIKSSKINLPKIFQLELCPGWLLNIDTNITPTQYTLTHAKKSMTFDANVASDLCRRNYSIRLAMGRRQMIVPPEVLQAFADNDIFLRWYDTSLGQGHTLGGNNIGGALEH